MNIGCAFSLAPDDLHTGQDLVDFSHCARQFLQKMWPQRVDTGLVKPQRQIGQLGRDPSDDVSCACDDVGDGARTGRAGGGICVSVTKLYVGMVLSRITTFESKSSLE